MTLHVPLISDDGSGSFTPAYSAVDCLSGSVISVVCSRGASLQTVAEPKRPST